MPNIPQNINRVQQRLAECARKAGRNDDDVTLLAVSKGHDADAVRAAAKAGLRRFGENYLQEALAKIDALGDDGLEWHFIGPIQSNKTRAIAEYFHWVHTVDRLKIARRLSEQRPKNLAPLNICLQVNIDSEASKAGADPSDVPALARAVAALPGLRLRGLMAIPEPRRDPAEQRRPFARLAQLLAELRREPSAAELDTLSMGMSADMEAAVREGATIVRVGTAIFGPRRPANRN